MIPYKDIAAAEQIRTPLAPEMVRALSLWCELFHDRAPWKEPGKVKSLNLCAMAASEIARQVVLEMKATVDAGSEDVVGKPVTNERSAFLEETFEGLLSVLRLKLEVGCAAGGMIVKPCPDPATGRIYFDFAPDWSLYPLAFDGAGNLSDVIIPDVFRDGETIYTRLERHTLNGEDVTITQRAFKTTHEDSLGTEVPLSSVERWAALEPEVTVTGAGGMLFGWYKVAAANTVDADCALGASVFAKAVDVAREIDLQYSRLLWEFEGG
ncbi:MAG: phage portal protein, partial [Clostridia bacterium]|nr:phage portal protein [Clostridia bacterium]